MNSSDLTTVLMYININNKSKDFYSRHTYRRSRDLTISNVNESLKKENLLQTQNLQAKIAEFKQSKTVNLEKPKLTLPNLLNNKLKNTLFEKPHFRIKGIT